MMRFIWNAVAPTALVLTAAVAGLPAVATTARAAEPPVIPLWPGTAPGEKGDIGPETEQPLKPGDNTTRVANVTKPTITVYRAPADKATGAAVVVCPGGGYNILAWNKEGTEVAKWLNSL